jgi:8-oxo-dGTP diphosphatase
VSEEEVEAAGGVVVSDGRVVVIHRPKYDDWTLPKGKLEPGESFEDAALREVREETGFTCKLRRELPPTHYTDHKERPKLVRWWLMAPESGDFAPNEEVDELRWASPQEAHELLSYERDRDLLADVFGAG